MFYKYLITRLNGKKVLYLYLNQDYEISNDLYVVHKTDQLAQKAQKYLDNMGVSYRGQDVYLVVNNIIVGKIEMGNFFKKTKYLEYVRYGKTAQVEILDLEEYPSLKLISFERSSGIIHRIKFHEYLFGVIAREMPFIEHPECLKAQAVIARTYLMKMLKEKKKVQEINKYQLYFDKEYLKKLWGPTYYENRERILDALIATNQEVLTFRGNFIECYTHYQNTGKTESSANILKISYPYLISVSSMDSTLSNTELVRYRKVPNSYLSQLLNVDIRADTYIRILESTSGNNVRYIQFGNKVFDGLILSRTLGLLSNHFTVQVHDDYTTFLTKGCGLGLGLSKCGAKAMAESGYNYKQILSHYYPNTTLEKISENIL